MDTDLLTSLSGYGDTESNKELFFSLIRNHHLNWLVEHSGLVTPIDPYGRPIAENFYLTGLMYAHTYKVQDGGAKHPDNYSIEILNLAPSTLSTLPNRVDLAEFSDEPFALKPESPVTVNPFEKGYLLQNDLSATFSEIDLPEPQASLTESHLETKERENLLRTIALMARLLQKADENYTKAKGQKQNPSGIALAVEKEAIALGEVDGQKKRTIEDRLTKGNKLLP